VELALVVALGLAVAARLVRRATRRRPVAAGQTALRRTLAIAGGELDFELIELVPLLVGPLTVGDREQFLQAAARRRRLGRIHPRIIPLLATVANGRRFVGGGRRSTIRTATGKPKNLPVEKVSGSRRIDPSDRTPVP
jgi:hypothetical protein